MAVHPTYVRFLIPLLAAVTLGATSASAADASPHRAHTKHSVRVVAPARPDSLDGTLVAPSCGGGPCSMNQTNSPSLIDWLKAQLARLAA